LKAASGGTLRKLDGPVHQLLVGSALAAGEALSPVRWIIERCRTGMGQIEDRHSKPYLKIWHGVLTINATPTFGSTKTATVAVNAFRGGGATLSNDLHYR
jgi:hypothetical protein